MNNLAFEFKDNWAWPSIDELFPGKYFSHFFYKYYKGGSLLDNELLEKINSVNLDVAGITVSYKPPRHKYIGKYGSVHIDDADPYSIAKLNYIIGGKDSNMVWFKQIGDLSLHTLNWLGTETTHVKSMKNLKEIYRKNIKFSLVEVGNTYHGIDNPVENRIALQCRLCDYKTKETISFLRAKEKLSLILETV